MSKEFLRRDLNRYSKLSKKKTWRKPKGRDNKMREKRGGYPKVVKVGYKRKKKDNNMIRISNPKELEKIKQGSFIIIGKVGKKKKIEITKKAIEQKIKIYKINPNKFLDKQNEPKK